MKEELLKHLAKLVELTKDGIIKGVDVIRNELPELIEQILAWELTVGIIGFVVGTLGIIIVAITLKALIELVSENPNGNWDIPAFIVGFFGGGISLVFFFVNLMKILKIWIAPRLYLIDYFTRLLSK